MTFVPGTRLGPYEIHSALGAGGMGEVYRARDTKLARDVAIKILLAAMAVDPSHVERFRREARTVAASSHPNIVTIYSVEEADGVHFLTMDLVEGRSLDGEIPSAGFPLDRFLEVAIALTDALAAAHERGIVHRDLKPANVMIDLGGPVKVLDFGLAKVTGAGATEIAETRLELTKHGTVVGTMPYMSPEQIEGRAVDARTDIFSLGVVLHEVATGTRPFVGESSPTLMASILRDVPRPIAERRPELSGRLGRLIARCLEKQPGDRLQTARDVCNELKALQRESAVAVTSPLAPSAAPRAAGRSWFGHDTDRRVVDRGAAVHASGRGSGRGRPGRGLK